jgi:hypothetical protein
MNEFLIHHDSGEFLVRTSLDAESAANLISEKWGLDVESIQPATAEDIRLNQGQWTELDQEV